MEDTSPIHFYDEPIEVRFDVPPMLEKKPGCPIAFTWRGIEYIVRAELSAWVNYERRGSMAINMRPAHASRASRRGSRGVGRFFFRVQVEDPPGTSRVFDIYYDRAVRNVFDTKGHWFIFCERQ
ncbi:MAG TPA: DUF6504 family protein [Anaerolineaceae bacterium]